MNYMKTTRPFPKKFVRICEIYDKVPFLMSRFLQKVAVTFEAYIYIK